MNEDLHKGAFSYIGHLYEHDYSRVSIKKYYEDLNHHMANRLKDNPLSAVGGGDDEKEILNQINIAKSFGLKPWNSLLDVGCGVLRAGKLFIDYLEKGKYTGVDISPEAIEYSKGLYSEKEPNIYLNSPYRIIPTEEKYDFIVCFWVTYDMPPSVFEKFLNESVDHMHDNSILIFSYPKKEESRIATGKVFTWVHDWRIVDKVVKERSLIYTEIDNFFNDDMTIAFMERD